MTRSSGAVRVMISFRRLRTVDRVSRVGWVIVVIKFGKVGV
jgi:hypothetical protein